MDKQKLLNIIRKAIINRFIYLNFSRNQLNTISSEIGQVTSLRRLNLSGNKLKTIPPEIGQLTSLERLHLSENNLSKIPPEIGQLTSLERLYFSSNQLREIPREIGQLCSLQMLYIWDNQLKRIPREIGQLTSLKELYLSRNHIKELPSEIGQLTSLQKLDLRRNHIKELPPEIGQLISLQILDLSENQLTKLPSEIKHLSSLQQLYLSGNQLSELSPEIRKFINDPDNAAQEIPKYYRQISEQGKDRIYEAKLLIVGEGGAGKTTLAKKIEDENYKLISTEQSTEGVNIIRWKFPFKDDKEFTVNIWDFGGQEIYHSTHQFFLTKRSLYILVADSRKENTDFFYWLNVVDLLSETSPILIAKNEKQDRKREINERQLRGEFLNLKEVFSSNLANNRGLPEIKQAIEHYITTLPHIGDELPKTWVKVRKALETNPHNHITLEEYLEICTENGFTRREDALQLSEYLHDLGVCLHFQEDDLLRKTVILKPTWGTDAAYRVLDNPQITQNLGRFHQDDLAAIWHEEQYAIMRPELLRLMINFKLCYEIPSKPKNYIAPQLLSLDSPEYPWDDTDNLLLRYSYEFMPKGILTRFIVEMHQWIEGENRVWKTGVILSKEKARAEVIELYHLREIRIRVCGDRKHNILATVRHELDKIHGTYERLRYDTLVPCNCKICKGSQTPHFYRLQILHKFQSDRQDKIQCQISYEMVNVDRLISDINKESRDSFSTMTDQGKYSIHNPEVVQIIENNQGQVIGKQQTTDPMMKKAIDDILQILTELQNQYPDVTESEAQDIIEVEFETIQAKQPKKWKMLWKYLFDRDRWLNGGRTATLKLAEHFTEESPWGKGIAGFVEGFSEEE
ncbi:MAG: COR domain-containing protein [Cyanobacteria bacterium P01_E01_bin.42]